MSGRYFSYGVHKSRVVYSDDEDTPKVDVKGVHHDVNMAANK